MRRRKGGVRNPGGEPRGFIGATDARRATIRLDLRACHAPRRVTAWDMRPQSLSSPTKKLRWMVCLPQANQDSLPIWETQVMEIFSLFGPPKAQKLGDRPN